MGDTVVDAKAYFVEGNTGKAGGGVHFCTGIQIRAVFVYSDQIVGNQFHGFFGKRVGKVVSFGGDIRFKGMGQHIKACIRRDVRRNTFDKLCIKNSDFRQHTFIHKRKLFSGSGIGNDRKLRHFGTSAAGGRNRD